MKKTKVISFPVFVVFSLLTACSALEAIAPLPQPTVIPTPTTVLATPTAIPTLGDLEYLDAAYCMIPETENIDAEYNLLRFFLNGVVLEMTVQGYSNCQEAWQKTAPYLSETATDVFSHGEYQLSGTMIQFWLAPAGSNKVAGVVTGKYEIERMVLQRQGTQMEYSLLFSGGNNP